MELNYPLFCAALPLEFLGGEVFELFDVLAWGVAVISLEKPAKIFG